MSYKSKIENFCLAIDRLNEAVLAHTENPNNALYHDALIQRFEFTFELSWKSLKEHLVSEGFSNELNSPRQVLKEAYSSNILHDEKIWNDMLVARNLTSHIYDETTSKQVVKDISHRYAPTLAVLKKYYLEQ